ncbi:hypothetical protein [Methanobrevibacter sp.]|uniref:hypothetical protein n=1 Tax=Methanobrevibacter sp. TaxID=66852 RepID=UPI003890F973
MNSQKSDSTSIIKFNYRDLLIFMIPLLIFIIYFNIYYPGILTLESFSQLHQIATNEFTNQYPFFHTFIEMICLKIFGNPSAIAILQILVFSAMWTLICKHHRDDNAQNSNVFFIQAIITLVICLIPINAIYSITLWNDILFCYFLMFLCFLVKVMIDKQGNVGLKYVILLALTMAFVAHLKTGGIYVVIPTLIILSAYMFRKKPYSKNMCLLLPALTIILILAIACLNFAYNVEDTQQGYKLHSNLNDAAIVWNIVRDADWTGEVYYINEKGSNIEHTKDKYFTSINSTPKEGYEDLSDVNHGSDKYKALNSLVNAARTKQVMDTLFNSPALYMYLAIILLVLMQIMFKTKEMYLVYLPNLFNIIIVFLTIPVQENRYLYANQLVFYLLVIMFISFLLNPKREFVHDSSKTPEISGIMAEKDDVFNTGNSLNEAYELEDIYPSEDIHLEEPPAEKMPPQSEEASGEINNELIAAILKEIEDEKRDK